jgi:DNA-binding NarL/FixJ family response regulator
MTSLTPLRLIAVDDDQRLRNAVLTSLTTLDVDWNVPPDRSKSLAEKQDSNRLATLTELAEVVASRMEGGTTDEDGAPCSRRYIDILTGDKDTLAESQQVLLLIHLNVLTEDGPSRLCRNGFDLYEEILARVVGEMSDNRPYPFIPPVLFYGIESSPSTLNQDADEISSGRGRITTLAKQAGLDPAAILWQLPEIHDSSVIARAMKFWQCVYDSNKAALDYSLGVVETVLERENAKIRHRFSDLRRPVVRILLGAVQSGDVKWEAARKILSTLSQSEPISHKRASEASINKYPTRVLNNYISVTSGAVSQQPKVNTPERLAYLLIDDEVPGLEYTWQDGAVWVRGTDSLQQLVIDRNDSGWGAALSCITKGDITCLNSPNVLEQYINEEGMSNDGRKYSFQAVLLDYYFGGPDNGGYFLRLIKNRQFALPVVMFTGFDDSTIAKWSLAHGASAYFVKEGVESEGRNSLYAYKNLRSIINFLSDSIGRDLWECFIAIERELEEIEETVWDESYSQLSDPSAYDLPSVTWNLRQAFYWLFLGQREIQGVTQERPDYSAVDIENLPRVRECAGSISIHSQTALEQFIACIGILRRGQKETLRQWADYLRKNGITGIYAAIGQAGFRANALDLKALQSREKDSHLAEPKLEEAIDCLASVLTNSGEMLRQFSAKEIPQKGLSARERLSRENGPSFPLTRTRASRSHAETAELGAKEIVEGWADFACPGSKNEFIELWSEYPSKATAFVDNLLSDTAKNLSKNGNLWHNLFFNKHRLLLIDDDYQSTGWGDALKILCGPNSITPWHPSDLLAKTGQDLDQFDLVLLDLRMPSPANVSPSPEVGIQTLQLLRRLNSSVPVLMLTASDEAYWTHRSLRLGAANYFLKHFGARSKGQTANDFMVMVFNLVKLLGRGSQARKLWREMVDIADLKPPLAPDAAALSRHLPDLAALGGRAPQQLNQIIWNRLEKVYDSYLLTMSNDFSADSRIDVDRWLLEGLMNPRYRPAPTNTQLYSLLLALKCGQLIECLAMLTMAFEFPSEPRSTSAHDILNGNLQRVSKNSPETFKSEANKIWAERNPAAHGFMKMGRSTTKATTPTALAAINPELATIRAIKCAGEWLLWLGWSRV